VINYQLALAINPPVSLSTNLRFHWFDLCLFREFPRLASAQPSAVSAINSNFHGDCVLSVIPSEKPLAFASFYPSRIPFQTNFLSFIGHSVFQLTFQPTSSLRQTSRRPVLPSNSTSSFHWMPHSPTFLLDRPPTCVEHRVFKFCFPTNFRLILRYCVSDFTLRSASGLRRRSVVQNLLSNSISDLRRVMRLQASPSKLASDLRQLLHSPVLSAINPQVPSEFESSSTALRPIANLRQLLIYGGASEPTFRRPSEI